MKKIFFFLIIITSFTSSLKGEGETFFADSLIIRNRFPADSLFADASAVDSSFAADSINIREMVALQIKAAIEKDRSQKKSRKEVINVQPEKKESNIFQAILSIPQLIKAEFGIEEGTLLRIGIIFFAAVLLSIIILIRRKVFGRQKKSSNKLKQNIELIRGEKSVSLKNSKTTEVRNELMNNPAFLNLKETEVSRTAKELNVAKGEIILAARIKSYELRMEN